MMQEGTSINVRQETRLACEWQEMQIKLCLFCKDFLVAQDGLFDLKQH